MRGKGAASEQAPQKRVEEARSRLASPATATALAVVVLLLAAAVIPLGMLAHQSVLANAMQLITGLPLGVVGFIVARRQPRNPIGWLLLAVPVGVLLSLNAAAYAVLVYWLGYRLPFGPVAVFLAFAYPRPVRGAPASVVALPRRRTALAALALGAPVVPGNRHRPGGRRVRRREQRHRHARRPD
jgi:hypothetical protein